MFTELQVVHRNIYAVKYSDPAGELPRAYAYRIIDERTRRIIPKNSMLAKIASEYCPLVYNYTSIFPKCFW